jgi:hypothetical protein
MQLHAEGIRALLAADLVKCPQIAPQQPELRLKWRIVVLTCR